MHPIENPYVSPESFSQTPAEQRAQLTKWMRVAATAIIVIGWTQILLGVIGCIVLSIVYFFPTSPASAQYLPRWLIVLEAFCAPLFFARTAYMIHGAWALHAGRHDRPAHVAAILATLGILFPFSPYEVPFGIWALILLRQDKRDAFENPV